jgi:hypothetical protein
MLELKLKELKQQAATKAERKSTKGERIVSLHGNYT